ncbi:MAG: hypothetical protein JWM14_1245 [Chitinophagaceae bacterium]|nr:hypothetical protein [Chitinophagaceae bacterium]
MKNLQPYLLSFVLSVGVISIALAQSQNADAVIEKLKISLKSGNSKELVSDFHDIVEVTLPDQEGSNYSKTQAEFVLRDFMKKYPPVDFKYVHKVLDREDFKFVIGEYLYSGGKYRVTMVIKPTKGVYSVDSIVFEK